MRATCPTCDAPVSVRARRCATCGYPLVEDEARARRRPGRLPLAAWLSTLAATGLAVAAMVLGGGSDAPAGEEHADFPDSGRAAAERPALEVLSAHPLSRREMERLLEERFTTLRDDDSASVRCSELEAKPAHAVRRCRLLYPTGLDRLVILITDARGRERLAGMR